MFVVLDGHISSLVSGDLVSCANVCFVSNSCFVHKKCSFRSNKYAILRLCLVTWPVTASEAGGDLALIQTSLLLLCK